MIEDLSRSSASGHVILLCLGNWDERYRNTRHNFGFILADFLAQRMQEKFIDLGFGEYFVSDRFRRKLYVFKGKTFMNLSGMTARRFLDFVRHREGEGDVVVVHDDADLEFGRIKISMNGGSGGHRGVSSIIEHIGKNNVRIRLGIGRPPKKDLARYVLEDFSQEEKERIPEILEIAFQAIAVILNESVEKSMSIFNARYPTREPSRS